jgi:hypothetical protein
MRQVSKYVLLLLMFNIVLIFTGLLLKSLPRINLFYSDIIVLSILFSVISAVTLTIFFRGRTREPDSHTMHTLVAVSLKFLLDMVLALVWFFISKKTTQTSVFIFFVIYLVLTIFTFFIILKTLRHRSLLNLNDVENKGSY